jgi:hypothetical protein
MTKRIDRRLLEQRCDKAPETLSASAAAGLVEAFGWLAPWMLAPTLVGHAATHRPAYRRYTGRPSLPSEPGGCWVLFVRPPSLPALRPAFALPLQWKEGVEHDPHLPAPLRHLADQVRTQLFSKEGDRWRLGLLQPAGEDFLDLSGLDSSAMGVSSGWAALVGGLLLARDGWVPNPQVWASAAWHDEYGIGPVEGLGAKLDLAAEWEARQVFVPAQNQPEVSEWRSGGRKLSVELLAPVNRSSQPARLLEPYLDRLRTEPLPTESFERRRKWYVGAGRGRANEFYWTHLLEDVVARCRARVRESRPECRPTHLVTVVGYQAPIVALAPRALEASHCLLLYEDPPDEAIKKCLGKVVEFLGQHGVEPEPVGVPLGRRAEELERIRVELGRFGAGVAAERLAFDLTPGYKFLSLELEELAPVGSWLLYCRHKQLPPDNRPDPGTEVYDCWRWQ